VLERTYQTHLIARLRSTFEGCFILKNDSSYMQGVPDLLVLYEDRWAMLEVKRSEKFIATASQRYYVELLNGMSYAAFVYPENEEDIFDDLQQAFTARRPTRFPKRKQIPLD
jgi:hypothetical protein